MACKLLDTFPEDDAQQLPWVSAAAGMRSLPGGAPPGMPKPQIPPVSGTRAETAALRQQLEEFKVAADQQIRAAFQQGFQQGEANARQKLDTDYKQTVERLGAAIAEISGTRSATLQRAEADTVRLAIEIARRVLHREVSVDPSALEGLVRSALDKLKDQEILRVRVHADLVKLLNDCLSSARRGQHVEVIPDPSRAPGSVVFEIARGSLDASLDTQLREIDRGLTDQLKSRS